MSVVSAVKESIKGMRTNMEIKEEIQSTQSNAVIYFLFKN